MGARAALQWHVQCTTPPSFSIMIATKPAPEVEPFLTQDFSLVLGGPLYQLWRGTRLAGDTLHLLHRRIIVLAWLAWVPLLLLSVAEGHAWGDGVRLPFLLDVETARAAAGRGAVADRGRADRAPADAAGRAASSWIAV